MAPLSWALSALLALSACGDASNPEGGIPTLGSGSVGAGSTPVAPGRGDERTDLAREGSAVALTTNGSRVLVADEDHSALLVVRLPLDPDQKPLVHPLPGRPAQIIVQEGRILVTIRGLEPDGGGALLGLALGTDDKLEELFRIALPADAWGLATSPSGKHALVSSAFAAKISRIDLEAKKLLWSREVAREPRGIAFGGDEQTAYVSHLTDSPITKLSGDLLDPKLEPVRFPAAPQRAQLREGLSSSLGYAIVPSPERDRLFFPRHALGSLGFGEWFGGPAVDVFDLTTGAPMLALRERETRTILHPDFVGKLPEWSSVNSPVLGVHHFVQPRAAVYRKLTHTLLIASEGTDALVELDAEMGDPALGWVTSYDLAIDKNPFYAVAERGGAPTGIALSADENTAYVYCRSTDELVAQTLVPGPGYSAAPPRFVKLADDLPEDGLRFGRRLFYNATDYLSSGGLACAGCHPEGRDDGYVWHEVSFGTDRDSASPHFENFIGSASAARLLVQLEKQSLPERSDVRADGAGVPRQTPMLVGRVEAKGPYGWRAESDTLDARIIAGFGLHRWREGYRSPNLEKARAARLADFLRKGLIEPAREKRELNEEEKRGEQVFNSDAAECSSCHAPETAYTNRSVAAFDNPRRAAFVEETGSLFKTPSLRFVAGSAPYFHDGRYASLEELVEKNGNRMGKTLHLSAEDKKALIAFLKTL